MSINLKDFLAGSEDFNEEIVDQEVETEEITDEDVDAAEAEQEEASEEVAEMFAKVDLMQAQMTPLMGMIEHVQSNGINSEFLKLFNSGKSLEKLLNIYIPSSESFDSLTSNDRQKVCDQITSGLEALSDKIHRSLRDTFMRPFSAIYRLIQSSNILIKKLRSDLIAVKGQLKSAASLPDKTLKVFSPEALTDYKKIDSVKIRQSALDAQKEVAKMKFFDSEKEPASKLIDELEKNIKKLEAARPERSEVKLQTFKSASNIASLVDWAIALCDSIIKQNKEYQGHVKSAFQELTHLRMGFQRNSLVRLPLKIMNMTTKIDKDVIKGILSIAKAVAPKK